jgi:hypothetical protein
MAWNGATYDFPPQQALLADVLAKSSADCAANRYEERAKKMVGHNPYVAAPTVLLRPYPLTYSFTN